MIEGGQVFRRAWVEGVHRHFPGGPKAEHTVPWHELPAWERAAANAVYEQVRAFVELGDTSRLSRVQKGRFVALCWVAQVYKHIEAPKASYVADWDELPQWQRETDADVFEHIEGLIRPLLT
ncbi:hypothetical protein V5P93_000640 [Actinokineospora auranticolor]|uniref:Uncharacterized protein n=1 Tax=Actinokineospora auranticolor TaxID=155976 RepID=A0A2S6GZ94_9PSEU|nr:hypothetical protein [Actinokineospora auranticolor]PPK70480.1 hypothetical protein CLV40_102395 [Actinokineospora auranticolor]